MSVTFWLFVVKRVDEKSAWYEPPKNGVKPPKRAEPVKSDCVTEPVEPAPPMVEDVGVVRRS